MMEQTVSTQRDRIHPYKFNLWVGLAAIIMMFAGFTSAYIVMQSRSTWVSFELPHIFWISTIIIIISSGTMYLTVKSFKQHNISRYKKLITLTAVLGLLFLLLQCLGFVNLYSKGIKLDWNVSAALLFVITGMHMLHVFGGVVVLMVSFGRAFRKNIRYYNSVRLEVVATYWHFVDILWIYLFLFFLWIR